MVTGNEVSARRGLQHPRGVFMRGNSKPATTFAEPAISTTRLLSPLFIQVACYGSGPGPAGNHQR